MTAIPSWIGSVACDQSSPRPGLQYYRRRTIKAVIDWPAALALILILTPFLIAVALRIRQDGGPALFVQTREGLRGRPIRIFKFRTMHPASCNPDAKSSVHPGDCGVTAFGAKLRETGLDELPQLFNVLNGTMSLIGPRPHVLAMEVNGELYSDIAVHYRDRLSTRPGITGLAQISGWCGPVTTTEHALGRIACDQLYIQNWSWLLDVKILAVTAIRLVRSICRHSRQAA